MSDMLLNPMDPSGNRVQPINYITKPMATTKTQTRYYVCVAPNASMHRQDGKRLGFVHGYLETDIAEDQSYLDREIAEGNPYIHEASAQEVHEAQMRLRPRETMKKQLMEELEPQLRDEITAKILQEMQEQATGSGDADRLAGVDGAKRLLERMKAGGRVTGATVLMDSPAPPLKGIVSSADITNAIDAASSSPALQGGRK